MFAYSESWVLHHLKKLKSFGVSERDISSALKINIDSLSYPDANRMMEEEKGNSILSALYDVGYFYRDEVGEIVRNFSSVDFHKAFLLGSPDLENAIKRVKLVLSHHISNAVYKVESRNGFLRISYSCTNEKNIVMTPQGHFAFLFKIIEGVFSKPDRKLKANVNVVHDRLPGINDFCVLVTDNVTYHADENFIQFALDDLQQDNMFYNPFVDSFLVGEFKRKYERPSSLNDKVILDVRRYLAGCMTNGIDKLSMDSIASHMNMSRSSLYRCLAEHQLTFSSLLEEERKSRAMHFLKEGNVSLSEISDRLGYSNLSAFNRAFKRWFDSNPSSFR